MTEDKVSLSVWLDAREDDRMEQGVVHQGMREDWRSELRLELRSFKNEMRVMLVATLMILKLDLPDTLTFGAVGLFGLKAALGFLRGS